MRTTSNGPTLNRPLVLFVSPDTQVGGKSIHIASTECYDSPYRECTMPIAVIAGTESGDYGGGPTARSNYRVLMADETIAPYLIPLIGSHGYQALAYPAYLGPVPLCEPLAELMDQLHDGDALDEDDELALESDLENEAWADYGRKDFRKELVRVLDVLDDQHEHDGDEITDATVDEVWHDGCDVLSVNGGNGCTIHSGSNVHFYTDHWRLTALADPESQRRKGFRDTLAELARKTRIVES